MLGCQWFWWRAEGRYAPNRTPPKPPPPQQLPLGAIKYKQQYSKHLRLCLSKKSMYVSKKLKNMAIKVNTIEEFKNAIARGITEISFGKNPELIKYAIDYADKINRNNLARRQGFEKQGDNFTYNLDSKFNFGKHKGNQLKCVYKCDPYYVEWCLINASGFIISSKTLSYLTNEKVFNVEDLLKYGQFYSDKLGHNWYFNYKTKELESIDTSIDFKYHLQRNDLHLHFRCHLIFVPRNYHHPQL